MRPNLSKGDTYLILQISVIKEKPTVWGMTVSKNELTANVLLNGHVVKMTLKYLYLYS